MSISTAAATASTRLDRCAGLRSLVENGSSFQNDTAAWLYAAGINISSPQELISNLRRLESEYNCSYIDGFGTTPSTELNQSDVDGLSKEGIDSSKNIWLFGLSVVLLVVIVLSAVLNGKLTHGVMVNKELRRGALAPLVVTLTLANLLYVLALVALIVEAFYSVLAAEITGWNISEDVACAVWFNLIDTH